MRFATAKLVISPPMPVRLAGYASRKTVCDGIKEDIYLRVHLFEQNGEQTVFLYADLIWWGSDFVLGAKARIEAAFGIPADRQIFVASHNHSGPPTGDRFLSILETYSPEYAAFLESAVLSGVQTALGNLEPITIHRHDGSANLSVFRRASIDGRIEMRPNYETPADNHLSVITFLRADGSLKGMMVHYACHANLSDINMVQPDYPGVALRLLDEAYPGCISIFLQGCTADTRPNSVLGDRFTAQDYEGVKRFATYLAEACKAALALPAQPICPQNITVQRALLPLPLVGLKSREMLNAQLQNKTGDAHEWAERILKRENPASETLDVTFIRFDGGLSFLTYNAEVSQYYAGHAKLLNRSTLSVGYCNGMIGYISTKAQILEGGYEPDGSAFYFALAGTFSPDIEALIHKHIQHLMQ